VQPSSICQSRSVVASEPVLTHSTDSHQIIQQIHLLALNPFFPQLCHTIHSSLSSTSASYTATYLLTLYTHYPPTDILVRALRHPVCDVEVARAIRRIWDRRRGYIEEVHGERESLKRKRVVGSKDGESCSPSPIPPPPPIAPPLTCHELPRRLFRDPLSISPLQSRSDAPPTGGTMSNVDSPHPESSTPQTPIPPLLPYLFSTYDPSPNSHKGYPLSRAVLMSHYPLIAFLLSHGADPSARGNMAVQIAIAKKDLGMVKMLVERDADWAVGGQAGGAAARAVTHGGRGVDADVRDAGIKPKGSPKRQKLGDRVKITDDLVQRAMEKGTREMVEYFVHDKGEPLPLHLF
jgi:hypothetical protein